MKRQLSIGIDLDPYLKKTLERLVDEKRELPIKWHASDSLHVLLIPLGHVDEAHLNDILLHTARVCKETEGFDLFFEMMMLAYKKPADQGDVQKAQRVVLTGAESEPLKNLYTNLSHALDLFVVEKKHFRPQVTLGKIRALKWQVQDSYPTIEHTIETAMDVSVITLFENTIVDGKREFVALDTFELA